MLRLPQDVLLYLATFLDVQDLFSLLATCHYIRQLCLEPTLWLDAITRLRTVQLHPAVAFTSQSLLDLPRSDLQAMVQKANTILRNLASPQPKLQRVALFRSSLSRVQVSFGYLNSSQCATLRIYKNCCAEVSGKALFAAVLVDPRNMSIRSLAAVYIDVRDLQNVDISVVVSPPVQQPSLAPRAGYFITPERMGYCTSALIISWTMQENRPVESQPNPMPVELVGAWAPVTGLMYDCPNKILYGFSAGALSREPSVSSCHLPAHQNKETDEKSTPIALPAKLPPSLTWRSSRPPISSSPNLIVGGTARRRQALFDGRYNVFAMTLRSLSADTSGSSSFLHFFPCERPLDDSAGFRFGESVWYELPRSNTVNVGTGHSGRYVFVSCASGAPEPLAHPVVGLVCLRSDSDPLAARTELCQFTLDLRDDEDAPVFPSGQIILDDTLGLVGVKDQRGMLTVFSYGGKP
ncbi:hypothetical protein C8F01DRAFT_1175332 [Mycena amicta]|nr:hypothetical protein C8F01DRAFT_1176748 [Mycena amicta]KAJ7051419.1 hypothetical protein C8F01DRAFT_1175332 [Mycena amicta]